jgi:hypothetical protein
MYRAVVGRDHVGEVGLGTGGDHDRAWRVRSLRECVGEVGAELVAEQDVDERDVGAEKRTIPLASMPAAISIHAGCELVSMLVTGLASAGADGLGVGSRAW